MEPNTSVTDKAAEVKVAEKPIESPESLTEARPSPKLSVDQLRAKQVDDKPDEPVDMDMFSAVKNNIEVAQKKVEAAEPEDKKEEVKVDDKVAAKPDNKIVELKQPDVKIEDKKVDDKEDKRNYDDLPEDLRPIFKKLHNEPFNKFREIIKELDDVKKKFSEQETTVKKLKEGALPENYYEHQRGYTLTPQFEHAANTAIKAEMIARHWEAQLDRVRKGEPTYQDINVDPRSGEITLSDPMQVGKDTEDKIAGWAKWAGDQYNEKKYAVRAVAESHTKIYSDNVSQVTDFEKTAFKNFDGEKAKEWEPIINDTINKTFPPAFRSNPLARGYAKAIITIQQLGSVVQHLQKNGGKAEPKVEVTDDGKKIDLADKAKAGPTNADLANAGGAGGKNDENVTIDDFKAVKNSY